MRVLTSAILSVLFLSTPGLPAAPQTPTVVTRPNTPLPVSGMQPIGPSSAFDVPPQFISGTAPIYPITRLRLREPGYAIVSFVIDETGRTRSFKVEKTNYSFFASHAIVAIQQWRFRPATKRGRPVSCRVRIPFFYRVGR